EWVSGVMGLVPTPRSFGVLGRQVGTSPIRTKTHGGRGEWVLGVMGLVPTLRSFGVLGRQKSDRHNVAP
ncbi:MAG: hypothetical protein LW870_20255, partial [Pirellula sp.]|nr:hypothetical protein [Pirellula sp.]